MDLLVETLKLFVKIKPSHAATLSHVSDFPVVYPLRYQMKGGANAHAG
jgi:hypothetical protein